MGSRSGYRFRGPLRALARAARSQPPEAKQIAAHGRLCAGAACPVPCAHGALYGFLMASTLTR